MKWKKNVKKKSSTIPLLKYSWRTWFFDLVVFLFSDPWSRLKNQQNHHSPSKTRQIHPGISKRSRFWREQTTRVSFSGDKKKTHPEQWTNPTICCQLCCLEFLFWVSTSRAPCRKNNFEGWKICQVLVVLYLNCWQSAPVWNFLKPVLGPFFYYHPIFKKRNEWLQTCFAKVKNHCPELLFAPVFRPNKNHWRIPVHPVCQTARPITTQWDFRGQTTWFTCEVSHFRKGFLPQATEEFTASPKEAHPVINGVKFSLHWVRGEINSSYPFIVGNFLGLCGHL